MRALILSLVFAGSGVASQAHAEPGSDPSLLERKAVGVLPVLAPGLSRMATFRGLGTMAEAAVGKDAISQQELTQLQADQGFGFAGASTSLDIALLQLGGLCAGLALDANDPDRFKAAIETLEGARGLLASLQPEVLQAFDKFIAGAKRGAIDGDALSQLFAAAEAGIAKGPTRAHGYLTAGLWFGFAMLDHVLSAGSTSLVAMASPLAVLFEEDADLSGSDLKVAFSLRSLARLLMEKDDGSKFLPALQKVYQVTPDQAE